MPEPAPTDAFTLDPRLEESSLALGDLPLCRVFLVDDRRFPWLMLVPRRAAIEEILDLPSDDRQALFSETMLAAEALRGLARPDKLNIGALGNVVPQLHVHVVARFVSDPAWPGPVWGHGQREPYPPHMLGLMIDNFRKALAL